MFSNKSFAILAVFGAVAAASASPVSLLPGTSVTPAYDYGSPGDIPGTLLDVMDVNFTGVDVDSNITFTGFLESAVLKQSDGTLAFFYVFQNDQGSTDSIERLSVSSFAGFTTAVDGGDTSNPGVWINPTSDTRSSNGRVLNFGFPTGSAFGAVAPGDQSRFVVVFTNATAYGKGSGSIIDGGTANAEIFAPAVPEPASMSVLAVGALALLRRRRKA